MMHVAKKASRKIKMKKYYINIQVSQKWRTDEEKGQKENK